VPVTLYFSAGGFINGIFDPYPMDASLTSISGTTPYNVILTIMIALNSNITIEISAFNITGMNNDFAGCKIFVKALIDY
jgi:hypothetical protein